MFQGARRIYNGVNSGALVDFVKKGGFDTVVTAHFLSTEVVGNMRVSGELPDTRLVTIVTDYDVHKIWLSKGVDLYLVACDFTRQRLLAMGVPADKVAVTGIPVDEKFTVPRDKTETRKKLGVNPDKFTVLLSTSSFGFGPIEELADMLTDVSMLIITGNNKELYARLKAKANPLHQIYGFVDNMEELAAASDVMITKPGGLSITEALANNLPLIFFSAIPGQEAGNVEVLKANGIGMSDASLPEITAEIRSLAAFPDKLARARQSSHALARPRSVEAIIAHILR